MESFENNEFEHEPEVTPEKPVEPALNPADDGVYHTAGTGRKESPYANSPYEMNHQAQESFHSAQTPPAHHPHKAKKPRKPIWRGVLAAVLAVALVAGGCSITAALVNRRWETREEALTEKLNVLQKQIESSSGSGKGTLVPTDGSAMTPSQLYASCVDSVVAISSTVTATGIYGNTSTGTSSGSGFILTDDGYIVTNYHVVEGATELTVTTHDGTEYSAELKGKDATNDVAVLKVEGENMPAVTLGSSHDLVIGDMVAAIGNPLGKLSATQTIGYVSGINREVSTGGVTTISMIQTDAAINPGNSGGPLINEYGQVIGINSSRLSSSSYDGIGFAIPINDALPVVEDLIQYGYVTGRVKLGITYYPISEVVAAMSGYTPGLLVYSVDTSMDVYAKGIRAGDIITEMDGQPVTSKDDIQLVLENKRPGDTIDLTFVRSSSSGSATYTVTVTLAEDTGNTDTSSYSTESGTPGTQTASPNT